MGQTLVLYQNRLLVNGTTYDDCINTDDSIEIGARVVIRCNSPGADTDFSIKWDVNV